MYKSNNLEVITTAQRRSPLIAPCTRLPRCSLIPGKQMHSGPSPYLPKDIQILTIREPQFVHLYGPIVTKKVPLFDAF